MEIPKKPKGMKDPVLNAGKWEERIPPPPTAGTTMVDINDPDIDEDSKRGLEGIPYRPADKKK